MCKCREQMQRTVENLPHHKLSYCHYSNDTPVFFFSHLSHSRHQPLKRTVQPIELPDVEVLPTFTLHTALHCLCTFSKDLLCCGMSFSHNRSTCIFRDLRRYNTRRTPDVRTLYYPNRALPSYPYSPFSDWTVRISISPLLFASVY